MSANVFQRHPVIRRSFRLGARRELSAIRHPVSGRAFSLDVSKIKTRSRRRANCRSFTVRCYSLFSFFCSILNTSKVRYELCSLALSSAGFFPKTPLRVTSRTRSLKSRARYLPTAAYVKVVSTIKPETAIHGIVALECCAIETGRNEDDGKFDGGRERPENCPVNLTDLHSASQIKHRPLRGVASRIDHASLSHLNPPSRPRATLCCYQNCMQPAALSISSCSPTTVRS